MLDSLNKIYQILVNIFNKDNPSLQLFRSLTCSNTGEVVKAGAGYVHRINIINGAASIVYVKLYNKETPATASDTPVLTLAVPTAAGTAVVRDFIKPEYFSAGISVRCVSEMADSGTTSPTAPIVEIRYT